MSLSAAEWEPRLGQATAGALYLHVPFCAQKCAYCDFASWATPAEDPLMQSYDLALRQQVREARDLGLLEGCLTAYVGGGTPTLLGAELGGLVREVRACAPSIGELTCEANPDSLTDDVIGSLVEGGATRVSVGVQSLDDGELRELERIHTADEARERVRAAVASGMDVSLDLMCAIPLQTDESWSRTLAGALGLGVGHVSVYPLSIEEGTPLARRVGDSEPSWNDEETQGMRMEKSKAVLEGAGFTRYEVASYSRPGKRCQHNIAYWTGVPYLGLGTGAAGMLTVEGYQRLCAINDSLPKLEPSARRVRLTVEDSRRRIAAHPSLSDARFSVEQLTEREAAAEDLMLGARLADGIDAGLVDHARRVLGEGRVDATLGGLVSDGLLLEQDGLLAPTQRGWLMGNELFGRLWDLAD